MKVKDLIRDLLNVGEKGANVARIIRSEHTLLELLVQEKIGEQKNERFVQDFKTLADVLVQQIVFHDLSQKFPGIKDSIYGEESNKFTNALGESINVEILSSPAETADLLCKVLNGNEQAANLLAKVVHEDISYNPEEKIDKMEDLEIKEEYIGIWIDPIDSTAQYIGGEVGIPNNQGFVSHGLQCACVLIGVYSKLTGLPIGGIINQPFASQDPQTGRWLSSCQWGLNLEGCRMSSVTDTPENITNSHQILLTSASDTVETKDKFSQVYTIHHAAGAGYKLLCVIQGLADAYVLSKNSTFKWDMCAPHAILLSLGGGVISYKSLCELAQNNLSSNKKFGDCQITYSREDNSESLDPKNWCNIDGVVAYRSIEALQRLISAVKTC
ncbi:inositol polyphosphate 1-phosphatase-like [Mytilus edulis]|uniref:INPP1 n=1 Tax=Mytilus edulis TaxID=6550 RepID=A0A8S3UPM7_MYTED|nr:INPP1 [Mytilus edulis]